ncbi:unnamed protein product [Linum trigynum]|uniref:Protein kinase domain-containing protein n=1 Tax=Linum trigynum TaxID=586398 RepID=A0AAV2F3J4_9ROSI
MATTLNPHSALPFLFLLLLTPTLSATTANPDLAPLMEFKAASDPTNRLSDWNPSSADPCNFTGVTCLKNRVTRLVLENLNLTTTSSHLHLRPLASLTHLRVLSLKSNSLAGPLPDSLSNLTSLKLLFLSHNRFSGEFPLSLLSLSRLYRLDLAHNNFSGSIPAGPTTLSRLTHLLTLRLEDNNFTGSISSLVLPPSLRDFNVSGNRLSGGIPKSMSGFPTSAFSRNNALCGEPLAQPCKSGSLDPTIPGSGGAISSPGSSGSKPTEVVASSPSSLPTAAAKEAGKPTTTNTTPSKIGPAAVIAIILGDLLVLAVVSLLLYCYFWRNYAAKMKLRKGGGGGPGGKLSATAETEKIVYSSSPYPNPNPTGSAHAGGGPRMMMVFFEGAKRFELEDLLRASAEMLGKGAFGTAYKAVLDDGNVVAVKRLKDANLVGGGSAAAKFEQQMEVLGRLRHPNLVSLRAYYFAREEKLLVYDYMANGSLFWLLHGNRGPGRTPLDWTTRLKIAAGAARGLAFIHSSCKALKLTHGNIKSTNVLLDRSGNARVSDFGLSTFASSSSSSAPRANGYRAPESGPDSRKLTQKSDVYSFGVLLLELLTGKCPSLADCGVGMGGGYGGGGGGVVDLPRWVQSVVREEWTAEVFDLELMRYKDIEEEMVGLLQIAMTCTSPVPDQRPKMSQVVKMIEELRGGTEVSPAHEGFDSVSDSPSLSEDTAGGGATSQ